MRYLLFVIFFLCFSSVSEAQKRMLIPINRASLNNDDNVLLYKFNIPNSDLCWGRIFMNNNRISVSYCRQDSLNYMTTHSSFLGYRKWSRSDREIPMKDSIHYISTLYPTTYGTGAYPIYLFYGDTVLYYSYLENRNSEWIGNRKLAVALGGNNSMIGVLSGTSGDTYALFNTQRADGTNCIIKAHSTDNGHNWNLVAPAIQHNLKELKGWCIASRSENPHMSYMLLTDCNNIPYYSHTADGGVSWSYPQKISTVLSGNNYKMTINNGYVVVAFRKLTDNKSGDHNDMMLWHGSLQELTSEQKKGSLMKIVDNEASVNDLNLTIEDITYYKSRHYLVLIKSFADGNSSLQIHLIRRTKY